LTALCEWTITCEMSVREHLVDVLPFLAGDEWDVERNHRLPILAYRDMFFIELV